MTKKIVRTDIEKVIKLVKGHTISNIQRIIDNEIDPLIDHLKTKNLKIRISLENYIIIRLVAYVEIQLKDFAIWLIDHGHNVDVTDFVQNELRIPITALDQIKDEHFTKGGIIATNFNFQNLKDIDFVFSRIYKLNFLETLKDYKNWPKNPYSYSKDVKKISDNWEKFEGMFEERNKLVHTDYSVGKKRSTKYYETLRVVTTLFCVHTFILLAFMREYQNKKSKNHELRKFLRKKYDEYKKQNLAKSEDP